VTSLPGEKDAAAGTASGSASVPRVAGSAAPGRRLGLALFLVSAAQFVLQLDGRRFS
jgi:hypothetical protein